MTETLNQELLSAPEGVPPAAEGRAAPATGLAAPPPAVSPGAGVDNQVLPIVEGYTLLQRLGSGQFGEVYRALAPGGIEVAVKRIFRSVADETSRRELHALELIRSLRHPYLLQTQAYWALEDRLVIVMELAEGSLADWAEECRRLGLPGIPADELLSYFREAAEALDYLHSRQVVHRDVKPANLLRLEGHAKVADFGLAKLQEEGSLASATSCGTPLYMAPETWQQQASVHSDQYSLALTYAEMRLGRQPIEARGLYEISVQHVRGTPDLAPLGKAEQHVLLKALAKDPHRRYPNCLAFVEDLARALRPPPPGLPVRAPARWRRAALAAALLACFGLGLALKRWGEPPAPPGTSSPEPASDPVPWVPDGFERAPDGQPVSSLGNHYFDRIVRPLQGAPPAVFLFVPVSGRHDPLPFYVMRDEVSRGQFRAVMADRRARDLLDRLAGANRWTAPGKWKEAAPDPAGDLWPVTGVTVMEAYAFAVSLGGDLPTCEQWDKAGGCFDGAEGPFKTGWKPGDGGIAVGLGGPLPVGTSPYDVSRFGCRDMAGNVREWTRDLEDPRQDGTDPLLMPRVGDCFFLRGHAFSFRRGPFTFKTAYRQSLRQGEAKDTIGFRVVIGLTPGTTP